MKDCDIIKATLGGDESAFAELIDRYSGSVWAVITRGLLNHEETADLTQRTFINAYFKLEAFKDDGNFGVWVRAIARNLLRNELRRQRREVNRMVHYHNWLLAQMENNDAFDAQERQLKETLERCRKKLSPTSSRALTLRYEQGLDFEVMSHQLGRTIEATRQLLTRVRRQLRQCVSQKEISS